MSPLFFAIYLERVLRDVRSRTMHLKVKYGVHNDEIPKESIYADDTEFINANMQYFDVLMEVIPQILRGWNLFVSIGKTERTRIGATLEGTALNEEGKPDLDKEADGYQSLDHYWGMRKIWREENY